MDKAIIIGAGTYSQVYAEYLSEAGYDIFGYLDDDETKHNKLIGKYKVLGSVNYLESIPKKSDYSIFVPIGHNPTRVRILDYANNLGFSTPSFIHPSSEIHNTVNIGQSVYILPSSSIMPLATIEDMTMISMGVNIAHHTTIGKGSFISQGANVGASINIGSQTFIGIASTLMTGVKEVGPNTTIGAGAVVIRDTPANSVVAGVPARVIKKIASNG